MTKRVAEKAFAFYVRQCSIRHSIQPGVICLSRLINNVEKKFRICFVFSRIACVFGKGNGFREEFHCTENTNCIPIMSDARWTKLCNYKQRDRMGTTKGV